jgi:hypothetical protein
MKLRDHPLMSYRGVSNWPPAWVGKDTKELRQPSGEIGILKNAILSKLKPHSRFYLLIEYEGEEYLGTLFFDNQSACHQAYKLLSNHRGEPVRKIGETDVPELGSTVTTMLRRRTCKVCGSVDNCDFKVVDDVWRTAIPIQYQNEILCLKCFEFFASEKQIELLQPKRV